MKFNCGMSWKEKKDRLFLDSEIKTRRLEQWHKWWAWYPVRVGERDCRWLEYVNRSGSRKIGYFGGGITPVYRLWIIYKWNYQPVSQ